MRRVGRKNRQVVPCFILKSGAVSPIRASRRKDGLEPTRVGRVPTAKTSQVYIAEAKDASRRHCRAAIAAGRRHEGMANATICGGRSVRIKKAVTSEGRAAKRIIIGKD